MINNFTYMYCYFDFILTVDCWDGDWNGQPAPIIKHGMTMTTSIPFEDVIKCIDKYAFTVSEYV